jgi:hypothetical protein
VSRNGLHSGKSGHDPHCRRFAGGRSGRRCLAAPEQKEGRLRRRLRLMRGEVRLPADKKGQEAWEIGRSRRKPQSNVGALKAAIFSTQTVRIMGIIQNCEKK